MEDLPSELLQCIVQSQPEVWALAVRLNRSFRDTFLPGFRSICYLTHPVTRWEVEQEMTSVGSHVMCGDKEKGEYYECLLMPSYGQPPLSPGLRITNRYWIQVRERDEQIMFCSAVSEVIPRARSDPSLLTIFSSDTILRRRFARLDKDVTPLNQRLMSWYETELMPSFTLCPDSAWRLLTVKYNYSQTAPLIPKMYGYKEQFTCWCAEQEYSDLREMVLGRIEQIIG